jgi:hydrogenase/urease accessory protein HupE
MRWPAFFLIAICSFFDVARAHTPGLSMLRVEARAEDVALTLQFSPLDPDGDARASAAEIAAGSVLLTRLAPQWLGVETSDGGSPPIIDARFDAPTEDMLVWRAVAAAEPRGEWRITLRQFSELTAGHRELVTVIRDDAIVAEALLSAEQPTLTFTWKSPVAENLSPVARGAFAEFLKLGVEHIVTGYDHLLYLAGLIIACRRLRSIVALITSFTVAHSLTLALATLGVVSIPSRVIEPLIAASIVYVGLENLWLRGREPRARWFLAFFFGLVHGFGFAGLLSDFGVGVGDGSIALPLLSFNLGVELGQLAILTIALPPLLWARSWSRFTTLALPAASLLVVTAGGFWFFERVSG